MDGSVTSHAHNTERSRHRRESIGTQQQRWEREHGQRPTLHRPSSRSSDRLDRSERLFSPSRATATSRGNSPGRSTRYRDYAENMSASGTYSRGRNIPYSLGAASLRRRVGSINASINPSLGPPHSFRDIYDSTHRSVAIAPRSTHGDDVASRKFSLAGPAPLETLVANQPYVDPGYAQLNPAYDQPSNVRPVWSLAKPLPHVLRPGMVPTTDELQQEFKAEAEQREHPEESDDLENGRLEPSLRPARISNQLDTLRRERELSLFRAYRHMMPGSPTMSPFALGRRGSDAPTEMPEPRIRFEDTVGEQREPQSPSQEEPPELHLPRLRESISNLHQIREEESLEVPYEDAVPLPAYQAEDDEVHNLHTYWSVIRLRFREPLAEFLAVTVQYTLGFSCNLTMTVFRGAPGNGDTANWGWGLAAMMGIYIAGGISGAQINPAISTMLYIYRGFPLRKVLTFLPAQMLGAFCAAMISYGLFQPGLVALMEDPVKLALQSSTSTPMAPAASIPASIVLPNFITFPRQPWVSFATAFYFEFVGTAILAISVLALGDDTNAPPGAGMNAFIIALLVVVLSEAFAPVTGLALNPNRDFSPRVAMTILGYSKEKSLWADGYWFKVAILGPMAGVLVGGFMYDAAIFVGGESPVNYPVERMRRAMRKWKQRWMAEFGKTKKAAVEVKNDVVGGSHYGAINS